MRKSLLLGVSAAVLGLAAPAHALPIFLDSVSDAGTPGQFRFEYRAEFANDEGIETGSRLVIYDFGGYVDNSIFAPAGITTSTEFTSADILTPGQNDDPSLVNLVFTYTGPRTDFSNQTFTGFGALSTFGFSKLDAFSSTTVKTGGAVGTLIYTQGTVGVPNAVPEPASWAMMLAGFGLAGAAMRRRTAKVVYA